jgi:hypothetical protein
MSCNRIVSSWISELRTASARISCERTAFVPISAERTASLAISREVTLSRSNMTAAVAVPPRAINRASVAVMLA